MNSGGDSVNHAGDQLHFLPVHRHATIPRPHICEYALSSNPALVVLRGSAGSGKALAATQISTAFAKQTGGNVVWVRFVKGQAGFEPVWTKILKSLVDAKVLHEDSGAPCLIEGGIPSIDEVIEILRTHNEPLMLVLDDAQRSITPGVEESVVEVLESVQQLVIAVTTKGSLSTLTSHRTRMRIPVRQVAKDHLYFTKEEIVDLITLRLPEETQPQSLGEAIHSRSNGWPFAVQALLIEREGFPTSEYTPLDFKGSTGVFVKDTLDVAMKECNTLTLKAMYVLALFGEMSNEVLCEVLEISQEECAGILVADVPFEYWVDETGLAWYSLHDIFNDELRKRAYETMPFEERKATALRAAHALRALRPRLAMQAAIIAEEWELLSDHLLEGTAITLSREQQAVTLSDIPETVRNNYPVIATFSVIHEYAFPSGRIGKALSAFKLLASKKLVTLSQQPGFEGLTATVLRMVVVRLTGNEDLAVKLAELATNRIANLANDDMARYSAPLQIGVNQVAITYIHAGRYFDALALLELMNAWSEHLQPKNKAHAAALHAWAVACLGNMRDLPELLQRCEAIGLPVNWHNSYIGAGYRIASAIYALEANDAALAQEHVDALSKHRSTIEHWPHLVCVETLISENRDGTGPALNSIESKMNAHGNRLSPFPSMAEMMGNLHARLSWHDGRVIPTSKKWGSQNIRSIYAALSRGQDATAGAIATYLTREPAIASNPRLLSEVTLLQGKVALRLGNERLAAEHARHAAALLSRNELSVPMRTLPGPTADALQKYAPDLPVAHASTTTMKRIKPLTPAEARALKAVSEHPSIKLAAESLFLSHDTVRGYMKSVYRKLGVNSREQAVLVAAEAGFLKDDDSNTG